MKIQIKATNTSLTPSMKEYVEKKIGSLEKFALSGNANAECRADVELEVTTRHHHEGHDHFRAEVTLHSGNVHIRAEEVAHDIYAAIDKVKDEVMRQLVSTKDRKISMVRRGGQKIKDMMRGINLKW